MCLRDKAVGWFILGKCVQDIIEVIEFVSKAGSDYFCDFFYLGAKWLWPFFDLSVVLVKDECQS
jgi:hypothetical protein